MKKSLFTLAALATIMASCTSDDLLVDNNAVNTETTKETAIGFGTFAQKATRAAENSGEDATISLYEHHHEFAVWGLKDVDVDNYVFGTSTTKGQKVTGTETTPTEYYTQAEIDAAKAIVASGYIKTPASSYTDVNAYNTAKGTSLSQTEFDALTDEEKAIPAVLYSTEEQTEYAATASKQAGDVKKKGTYSWTYSPIRFWDKNSNRYDFYAAAPITASDATPHWELNGVADAKVADKPQNGYFKLADVTLADKTLTATTYTQSMAGQTNPDYMIADKNFVVKDNYGNQVAFNFDHILSRLNITIKKGANLASVTPAADAKLQIVKLEVHNLLSKGSFNESLKNGTDLSSGTYERWTSTSEPITYNGNVAAATDVPATKMYIMQSLIIPQTATKKDLNVDGKSGDFDVPYLYIEYKIGTDDTENDIKAETFKAYYNLAGLFGVTTSDGTFALNEGWQNTLNITIDATAITFTADTYLWEDDKNETLNIQ